tara:strand:+ start:475 stop:1428 length:954 start_codon:yes stop_codon:yes gene_type:complete
MPRNVYFSQAVKSEQDLYEDLIVESLKIYGQDVYYIPRTIISRDNILGEDRASKFDDAYLIEAYIENAEGFEGAGDLYQKFGLEIRDEATFIISRRQWRKLVGFYNNSLAEEGKPKEGDLIFLPMSNSFFEINFVEDEQPFYQLENLPVYKLQCALYEYNDEDFDTGIDEIDIAQIKDSYQITMDYNTVVSGQHFEVGETVTQELVAAVGNTPAIKVFGEVATTTKTSDGNGTISVSNIGVSGIAEARDFIVDATKPITGSVNSYTATLTKIYDVADDSTNYNPADDQQINVALELEADSFLDFTETNPFGDPSETY